MNHINQFIDERNSELWNSQPWPVSSQEHCQTPRNTTVKTKNTHHRVTTMTAGTMKPSGGTMALTECSVNQFKLIRKQ